ncbi:MAG: protein translocase subunit SecF [Anaerolineae bacterium]|nr:protein translocase subunit SecF [Anaerolineae bacterium]
MFNIVQRRKWFFLFSGVVILAGLIAMAISIATYKEHSPIRLSIDFVGGSLFEFQFKPLAGATQTGEVTEALFVQAFNDLGAKDVRVQRLQKIGESQQEANSWQVRSDALVSKTSNDINAAMNKVIKPLGLEVDPTKSSSNQVSPTVGSEVTRAAVIAVIVASAAVLAWIAFAFRNVKDSFRYGVCAVLAMIHDVLIMVGIMSIMGLVFGWEADSLFLTGLLTVVGYSVQDTIVVFDRIRENVARHRGEPYEMIVNRSIMETLQRSISMQVVVSFVLVALFVMGGTTIRQFVGVLLIGLLSGTYSSIFVAIPLLVAWEEGQLPFVGRGPKPRQGAVARA